MTPPADQPARRRPRPETIPVDGAPAGVLRLGDTGLPPMLLVHGFCGDMTTWQFNLVALARHFHVMAVDLPGHGLSAGQAIGHWRDMAGWLGRVSRMLDPQPPHLVGHSLGGRLVLAAAESGMAVRSLTTIAAAGISGRYDYGFLAGLTALGDIAAARAAAKRLFGAAAPDLDMFARGLLDKLGAPEAQDRLRRCLHANFGADDRDADPVDWARIAVPVQTIWGRDDTVAIPPRPGALPADVAQHWLDDTGHMPHVAAADTVNTLIAAFASRHS